eukprot:gene2008-5083_t
MWGSQVFYRSCWLVKCDKQIHVQTGRRLIATEELPIGTTVALQRGVAVPVPYLSDPLDLVFQQEVSPTETAWKETNQESNAPNHFPAHFHHRGQETDLTAGNVRQEGNSEELSKQYDKNKPQRTSAMACPVCFADPDEHLPNENSTCRVIACLLATVEAQIYPRIQQNKHIMRVDETLLRLWLRILAILCVKEVPDIPEVSECLHGWNEAIKQLSQLETSAPSEGWIADVFRAATVFIQLLEPSHIEVLTNILCPIVAVSQTSTRATSDKPEAAIDPLYYDISRDSKAAGEAPKSTSVPSQLPTISPEEALVIIAGQVNCNGYALRNTKSPNTMVGLGLFPAIAMVNHSCSPNSAVVTLSQGRLAVVTLQPIRKHQELTVSYVDLLRPRAHRKEYLLESKNFSCHCLRCQHPDAFPHDRALILPLCPFCSCLARWSTPSPSLPIGNNTQAANNNASSEVASTSIEATHSKLNSDSGEPAQTQVKAANKGAQTTFQSECQKENNEHDNPFSNVDEDDKQEYSSWLEDGYILTCWTEDGGCGRVLPPDLPQRVLPPLHDAISRCQTSLTQIARLECATSISSSTNENHCDRHDRAPRTYQEAIEKCRSALYRGKTTLDDTVGKTVSQYHHSVIQLQCLIFTLSLRTLDAEEGISALRNAVVSMEKHLPNLWPELNEWRIRLLEAHNAFLKQLSMQGLKTGPVIDVHEQQRFAEAVRDAATTIFGKDHPFYDRTKQATTLVSSFKF